MFALNVRENEVTPMRQEMQHVSFTDGRHSVLLALHREPMGLMQSGESANSKISDER